MLWVLLGVSVPCCCQIKWALQDVSDEGSPLRVSGTISLQDDPSKAIRYTYRAEGSVSNESGREVVLAVIHFEASVLKVPALNLNHIVDRFFSPTVLRAAETEKIDLSLPEGTPQPEPEEVDHDPVSVATAEVTFVQFVDGSTWGDADPNLRFIVSRKNTLNELNRLNEVLDEQGVEAFTRELSISAADPQFTASGALVWNCKMKPSSCLIDGLHSMLLAAAEHQAEMKDCWDAFPDVEVAEHPVISPE
jgi:hypothetical protein